MSCTLEGRDVPYDLVNLIVFQLVKNAVRADQEVVKSVSAIRFEYYIWLAGDTIVDAAETLNFGLSIAESPADGQSAWEDSIRTHKRVLFIVRFIIWRRFYSHLMNLVGRH